MFCNYYCSLVIVLLFVFNPNNLKAQLTVDSFKDCDIQLSKLSDETYNRYAPVYYKNGILYAQSKIGSKEGIGTKLMFSRLAKGKTTGYKKGMTFLQDTEKYKNVGPVTVNEKYKKIYFTANHPQFFSLMNNETIFKLSVYEMDLTKGKAKLMFFNAKEFNCMHPSISSDDKTLIFSTDEVGGVGNSDLYVCYKYGKSWSSPEILGEYKVNSSSRDLFPNFINDETIIFASDRPEGYGKLDLYMIKKTGKEKWTAPVNLGSGINSEEDDFGLIVDIEKNIGIFTSKRNGGVDQLFEFQLGDKVNSGGSLDKDAKSAK